jgi:hypothetical protein
MELRIGKVSFNTDAFVGVTKTEFKAMQKKQKWNLGDTSVDDAYEQIAKHLPKVKK